MLGFRVGRPHPYNSVRQGWYADMLGKKIGVDPALMATPMISSITDMVSSVIFLFTASLVLGIAL